MDTKQHKKDIIMSYENDNLVIKVLSNLDSEEYASWMQSDSRLLVHKSRIYIPNTDNLHLRVFCTKHNHLLARHPGQNKTNEVIAVEYFWPDLQKSVRT